MEARKLNLNRPDVFGYHDYREFLRDHFEHIKSVNKISLRTLCKNAGLSHGYLSLVVKNQRNLTRKALQKLAPHIYLTESEVHYLSQLVVVADSHSATERNRAFQTLKKSHIYRTNHPKEFETYKYLENWLNVAIRELALTPGFQADPSWIQKQIPFPVRTSEVERSLSFLIEHNFLEERAGKWTASSRTIQCLGGVFQLSLRNFHHSMLQLAQEALERFGKEAREQVGYTLALPKGEMTEVKKILEEAKNKIKALEEKNRERSSDTVYHVNFSAFPIAGEGYNE